MALTSSRPPAAEWPAVSYEEVPWDVHPTTGLSRRDRYDAGRPYRAAVPPEIRERDIRLSGEVAAEAEQAAAEIAQLDTEMGHRIAPWRDDQVWIGGPARLGPGSPHRADFVPPVAPRVPGLVDDLVSFAHREDLPALPQAAVAHAQFETIHPFPDGNGRTGRALLHAMLRSKGIARHISVPISAGILTDTDAYFRALTAYRGGDLEPIVSCVARASLTGVAHGRALVEDLARVRASWDERLVGLRSDSGARRLADGLLRYPVIAAAQAREVLDVTKNEHRAIDALVERGILLRHQDHKTRTMTWRAQEVLDALDRYAVTGGRRRRTG